MGQKSEMVCRIRQSDTAATAFPHRFFCRHEGADMCQEDDQRNLIVFGAVA